MFAKPHRCRCRADATAKPLFPVGYLTEITTINASVLLYYPHKLNYFHYSKKVPDISKTGKLIHGNTLPCNVHNGHLDHLLCG